MDLGELKRRAEDILEQRKLAKELDEYSNWGADWED
jgi:glutaredoxin-related protein